MATPNRTYEDRQGNVFNTRDEALRSNQSSTTPTRQTSEFTTAFNRLTPIEQTNLRTKSPELFGNTITSDNLKSTPSITVPNTPVSNFGNISPEINSSLLSARQQRERENQLATEEAKQGRDKGLKDILDITEFLGQSGKFQEREFQKEGVDTLRSQYDDFTNQLEQEQHSLTRKLQEIEKNPQGVSEFGLQDRLRTAERDSLSKQADLAILQNSSLRKYDTARSIAERKVELQLEPIKARLESLKFIYQENKDLFNTTEKRAYEERIRNEDRDYKTQEENKTKGNEYILNALQGGAPSAIIQKAQSLFNQGATAQEIASALGGYSMSPTDRLNLELAKIKIGQENQKLSEMLDTPSGELRQLDGKELASFNQTPQVKDIQNAIPFKKALQDYKKAIETYGTGEIVSGKGSGALDSAFMTLAGFTKDFYKLGTLDNGVEKLIDLGIKKPGIFGRSSSRLSSIGNQIAFIESLVKNNAEELSVTDYGDTIELQTLLGNALTDDSDISSVSNEDLLNLPNLGLSNTDFFNSFK